MSSFCQSCGACCAKFRVSFYWGETDAHPGGTVPQRMVIPISPHLVAMRGTEHRPARCSALEGEVGQQVGCAIYPLRSSTCREFEAGTSACNAARAHYSLAEIDLESEAVAA